VAGLSWLFPASTRSRGQATAVVACLAVAVATAVASISVVASVNHLTSEPARYGAPWHAVVTPALGSGSSRHVVDRLASLDGVEAAAGIVGNDGRSTATPSTSMRSGRSPGCPAHRADHRPRARAVGK
jgi:hypothetical protein